MDTPPESRRAARHDSLHDVIIAGGGPVGLFLACELALAECSVLILEKMHNPHSPLKQLPFGIRGLSAPTIEALDRRGLLAQLQVHKRLKNPHQNAKQGPQRQGGHFGGIPFHDCDVDTSQWRYRLPSSTATNLLSEMAELESVLGRRAEALGVEIRRGYAITDCQQAADEVTVWCDEQSFRSKWLVGCDGSRSVIRKAGGFEFAGTEPEFTGYSVQAEIADPQKLLPGRNLTSTGMYFQSQPGYLVMVEFDGGAAHRAQPTTLGHIQEVLRRVSNTDATLGSLAFASTWTDRARQATTYRNGRIFLAGDAAHIHAPLGGQGLNLGLGDAMNLGWKLATTLHEQGSAGLLDSYQTERHPLGAQVLNWSRAQVAIMKPDPASRALNAILSDLMRTRDGATYIAGRVWGVSTRYDLASDHHPLAGHSVPNFEFRDGTRMNDLMHEGGNILLDFDGNASLKAWAHEHRKPIQYVFADAKEALGLSAVLIRPDGIIAWASADDLDTGQLERVAAHWAI